MYVFIFDYSACILQISGVFIKSHDFHTLYVYPYPHHFLQITLDSNIYISNEREKCQRVNNVTRNVCVGDVISLLTISDMNDMLFLHS